MFTAYDEKHATKCDPCSRVKLFFDRVDNVSGMNRVSDVYSIIFRLFI